MIDPEQAAAIAAKNAQEVERARQAAEPGSAAADTVSQLDTLSTGFELAAQIGGLVLDGVNATGRCIGSACDLLGSIGD